jgi:hypothetical protein
MRGELRIWHCPYITYRATYLIAECTFHVSVYIRLCEDVDWFHQLQESVQLWALMNTETKLRIALLKQTQRKCFRHEILPH